MKLVYCLRRLPHLSREEFQRYWLQTHGPMVAERAKVLGIRRYVQVHTLAAEAQERMRARNGAGEEFDGVAELWFDDPGAVARTDDARAAGRELLDDEHNFIDVANSPIWMAEEHELVSDGRPA